MLKLAIEKCKKIGILKVLVTCDFNNKASARVIEKNGGLLENIVNNGNDLVKRYWIQI